MRVLLALVALLVLTPSVVASPHEANLVFLEELAAQAGVAVGPDEHRALAELAGTLGGLDLRAMAAAPRVAPDLGAAAGMFYRACLSAVAGGCADIGVTPILQLGSGPCNTIPLDAYLYVIVAPPTVASVSAGTDTVALHSAQALLGIPAQVTHPAATFTGTLCLLGSEFPGLSYRIALGNGVLTW